MSSVHWNAISIYHFSDKLSLILLSLCKYVNIRIFEIVSAVARAGYCLPHFFESFEYLISRDSERRLRHSTGCQRQHFECADTK